jgi:hypothetical protein
VGSRSGKCSVNEISPVSRTAGSSVIGDQPCDAHNGVERGDRDVDGCLAMQCSLAPRIAWPRFSSSSAAQPDP